MTLTVETTKVRRIRIIGAQRLDPVDLFIDNVTPTSGSLVVRCFDQAWHAWWGNHGCESVEKFILSADIGYLTSCLIRGLDLSVRGRHTQENYLLRICAAMQDGLRAMRDRDVI